MQLETRKEKEKKSQEEQTSYKDRLTVYRWLCVRIFDYFFDCK